MILQIDWASFTPASAAVGGAMIGVAAVMFAALGGRIAGISGIVAGVVRPQAGDLAWRLAFIAGLIAVPALYVSVYGALDIRIQIATPRNFYRVDSWGPFRRRTAGFRHGKSGEGTGLLGCLWKLGSIPGFGHG